MNNNIELLIGNPAQADLDLDNGFDVALQYSIADIKDISKRNSAYSKTIILPGTKNNNYWLGNLFDINADFSQFNPNKKTAAKLLVNSEIVLNGFLQLKKIKKLVNVDHQGNKIQYEVVLFDNAVDLMTELGEKNINILDFSEFEHVYNRANIIASWSHTYEDGYVYPMYGTRDKNNVYAVEQFYPSMFYKTVLNRILFEAGYGMKGSLTTNKQFEKEIIAYTGDKTPKISALEIERRKFRVGMLDISPMSSVTGAGTISNLMYNFVAQWNDTFTPPNFENDNHFDTVEHEWVADRNGLFSFNYSVNYNLLITNNYFNDLFVNLAGAFSFTHTLEVLDNGVWTTWPGSALILNPALPIPNAQNFPTGTSMNIAVTGQHATGERIIYAGQKVRMKIMISKGNGSFLDLSSGINITSVSLPTVLTFPNTAANALIINPFNGNIAQGDTIDFTTVLSDKIKQKDLISDLIKRYNLFIQVDPDNPNLLIFDSRGDFYETGKVLDWTEKKDYSSEDNIELLSELQFKSLLYSYKPDNDVDNAYYTSVTGDVYGQFRYTFDNDFVKGEKKIESVFSPTPLIRTPFNAIVASLNPDEPKGNPRVLFWGGLKPCDNWVFTESNIVNNVPMIMPIGMSNGYPYAGHLDDPINPDLDINFGTFKFPMYGGLSSMTNNNMFNQYWFNYADQISEGRLVTSKFYLTEADIRYIKNNFNSKIFILDSYYYVNKIKDYKPLSNGVTEVELLKIKDGVRWRQTSAVAVGSTPVNQLSELSPGLVVGGSNTGGFTGINIGNNNVGGGSFVGQNGAKSIITQIAIGNNNQLIGSGLASGDNNIVSNKSAVIGDNNYLESESSLVLGGENNYLEKSGLVLRGDNNTITGDNITLVSAFGVTASISDSIYLGNKTRIDIFEGRVDTVDIKFEGKTKVFNGDVLSLDDIEGSTADRFTLIYDSILQKWIPAKRQFINYFDFESNSETALTQNVFNPLSMVAASQYSNSKFSLSADGVLVYGGPLGPNGELPLLDVNPQIFKVEAIVSGSSGNNNEIHAAFFKNDVLWPCSEQSVVTSSGGKASNLSFQCLIELELGDAIQIYIKNTTSSNGFVLQNVNVIVTEY